MLAGEGVGVVGPQLGGADRHHLLEQRLGRGVLPLVPVQHGQMVLGGDGVEVVGPQQPLPCLACFDEDHLGLLQVAQFVQRNPQHVLESGHHQRVAHRLAFQLPRRFTQPPAQQDAQRLSFLLRGDRIQVPEHRGQDLGPLLDLGQPLLRFLLGPPFPLRPLGLRDWADRAFRRACSARIMPQVVPAMPATRARTTRAAARTRPLVPPHELPQPVAGRRRAGLHRLVGQVALHVRRQAVGRLVAAVAVLLQRLHHDPVQLAAHQPAQLRRLRAAVGRDRGQLLGRAQPRARPRRLLLADDPQHLRRRPPRSSRFLGERRRAGQQLVQEHAQASRCRCGCRCRGCSARPAPGSCTPACRPLRRSR